MGRVASFGAALRGWVRRHPKKIQGALGALALLCATHFGIAIGTRIEPPAFTPAEGELEIVSTDPVVRRFGRGYARRRGGIWEVRLAGTPEQIGTQHGRLMYPEMVENEGSLYRTFEELVPIPPVRWLIADVARITFRDVDSGMQPARLREIAAQASVFSPDPYDGFLPTYHRFVFLNALYDISLSFEHSPLIGCSSFALSGDVAGGGAILARNFDFEAGPVFDEGKAVFLVLQDGDIPFASVSWPGLVGVVTGVNAEGVALAVHGGRAGETRSDGEPVVHTLRHVLATARTTGEALETLAARPPMVSHLVIVTDRSGDSAVAERVPGQPQHVRRGGDRLALTNHFEGPHASDPKNEAVETKTSTWPRRRRLDELLSSLTGATTVGRAVEILRDKRGVGDQSLALGDRRALDALIATHSVVIDAKAGALWVSEGPHLVGRFVRFDLTQLLDPRYEPRAEPALETLPADPIAADGSYEAWVAAGSPRTQEGGAAPEE